MQAQSGPSSPSISSSSGGMHSPPLQSVSPIPQPQQAQQQNMFAGNPNAMAYQMPQMTPMMQMQMMGMNIGNQFGMPQVMHQSVMRNPSPGPQGQGQGFIGMPGFLMNWKWVKVTSRYRRGVIVCIETERRCLPILSFVSLQHLSWLL